MLSEPLAAYALERMQERGVTFKLNARLADARQGVVIVKSMSGARQPQARQGAAVSNASSIERSRQDEEEIHAQTLVWAAGTTPNPLLSIPRWPFGILLVSGHSVIVRRSSTPEPRNLVRQQHNSHYAKLELSRRTFIRAFMANP